MRSFVSAVVRKSFKATASGSIITWPGGTGSERRSCAPTTHFCYSALRLTGLRNSAEAKVVEEFLNIKTLAPWRVWLRSHSGGNDRSYTANDRSDYSQHFQRNLPQAPHGQAPAVSGSFLSADTVHSASATGSLFFAGFCMVHRPALYGTILSFSSARVAVFVDGWFRHGCPEHGTQPKNNAAWWAEKIETNKKA